ncbi:MAG TPA: FHA domain-containing protein [Bryobacteraceae bacterium]|nr:FHA domain-containing protein [Bryobacteraceae bacterium]
MPGINWVEKLGRAIFEAPFAGTQLTKDAPEMAEIRLAILDEIRSRTHRVAGREVFPWNVVRITLRGVPEEQAGIFRGSFFSQLMEQEMRAGLEKARCRFPSDLRAEVETTAELPQRGEQWLIVNTEMREAPKTTPPSRRTGRLVVVQGKANKPDILLTRTRTNIGRPIDVFREDGPSRRNDIYFPDDTAVNRSVSREHAHIMFHKAEGEYRIYNDRWYKPGENCGVWIMRDGLSHEVHRTPRGTRLEPGDEIHLGSAVLRFQLDGPLRKA